MHENNYLYALRKSNSMRTTLDLPEDLIKETMELTGAKTKTEAIKKAMQELINQNNHKKLRELKGTAPYMKNIDLDELRGRNWMDKWEKYGKPGR